MQPHGNIPIGYHTVASRVRQPLRIYSGPGDKEILSFLRDSAQDFSRFDTPDDCNIVISIQGDQAIVRLTNMSHTHSFCIQPTAAVLARVLKASWQFFSELDRTADFPGITQNVQFKISELRSSGSRFPGAPTTELLPCKAIPCENDSFILQHGSSYGLQLTNNSGYDLYPTVQWFDPSNDFKFGKLVLKLKLQTETYSPLDTWYRPPCSRSRPDVPLKKDGGSLTIGYGSGGSPPLSIPTLDAERSWSLKISLFSRPADPLSDVQSFRSAKYLPDNLDGPWATITKRVTLRPSEMQSPPPDFHQSTVEYTIAKSTGRICVSNKSMQLPISVD